MKTELFNRIANLISEHPFGISDAAIDEIMEAVEEYGYQCEQMGYDYGYDVGYEEGKGQ